MPASCTRRPLAILASLLLLGALVAAACPAAASPRMRSAPVALNVRPLGAFTEIYTDSGTGAEDDLSVWRPDVSKTPGYFSLGDVAMADHGTPPATSFVISGPTDALAPPVDYQRIWTDRGSGGDQDGSVWAPVAPPGYQCLGSVAAAGYDKPSTDLVRCVKSLYLVAGTAVKVWDDTGSGADGDLGIWQSDPSDAHGLSASTFIARPSHTDTGGPELYKVLDKTRIDVPGWPHGPVTAAAARAFAPRVWLHSKEEYFPSSVAYFLPHVHEDSGYLVTNEPLGCDACTDPPFLRGQRPDLNAVDAYAEIVPRTRDGAVTNVTDIFYWMFFPYNRGKDVCVGWDSPMGCVGGTKSFGNHVGDWAHLAIRFVDGLASQVYVSTHSGGTLYTFGDKNLTLTPEGRPVVYAGQGSHELYAAPGRHIYHDLPNGGHLADDTDQGFLWDTAQALTPFAWQAAGTYTGSLSWLNISSRWGNHGSGCLPAPISQCVLEDGPEPVMDRDYAQPPLAPLE